MIDQRISFLIDVSVISISMLMKTKNKKLKILNVLARSKSGRRHYLCALACDCSTGKP